jgi:hypothetical protein
MVSDILKKQDQASAAALAQLVEAMRARYPNSLELKCAARDLSDFVKTLAPEPEGEVPR